MYDNNCFGDLSFSFSVRQTASLYGSDTDPRGKWYGHLMLGNSCLSPICRWPAAQQNIVHHVALADQYPEAGTF